MSNLPQSPTPGQQMDRSRSMLAVQIEQAHHDTQLLILKLAKNCKTVTTRLDMQAYYFAQWQEETRTDDEELHLILCLQWIERHQG